LRRRRWVKMDMSTRLEILLLRPIRRAWRRFLGLFSKRHCFSADVIDAMERGEGTTTFIWWWDGEEDGESGIGDLMGDIDEAIRRAPSPMGIDEFFLHIAVCGSRPEDPEHGIGLVLDEPRATLRIKRFALDRYYDWLRGNARERVQSVLEEIVPRRQAPLVAIRVIPIGGALASVCKQGLWRPVSPWIR
jgi:hypothetical protein